MKKLTIGRNNACDIIIPDTSDLVSRKQAVLTYSFLGKMVLYDTSNNGTYVNGQKLENGKGICVTRKDRINFARIADLDWSEVKDPYRKTKITTIISFIVIVIVSILLSLWFTQINEENTTNPSNTEMSIQKGKTITTVQPKVVNEEIKQPSPKPIKKKKENKSRSLTPKEVINKEVNNNSPIIY